MAQTKKKRRTKHRGNAAGMVEARGRTGRAPSTSERGKAAGKPDRRDRPPSWRSAANRSLIAVVIFVAVLVLFLKQPVGTSMILGAAMLAFYIPLSYFTDRWIYRRRMAKLGQGAGGKAPK